MTNPFTGRAITIRWLKPQKLIVETAYADGKHYIFTIDNNNNVNHLTW